MAKKAKGNRVQVILECTEMKDSGMPGTSRYITTKNRKNTSDGIHHKTYKTGLINLYYKDNFVGQYKSVEEIYRESRNYYV